MASHIFKDFWIFFILKGRGDSEFFVGSDGFTVFEYITLSQKGVLDAYEIEGSTLLGLTLLEVVTCQDKA